MSTKFRKKSSFGGLVMTRKEGDQILINHGEVVIEVVEILGKYVRLSFKSSREIAITRAEVTPLDGKKPEEVF